MKKILLIVLLFISSCELNKKYDYSNIDESRFINWKDIFNAAESGYFYIFSYTCPNCEKIKNEVIGFLVKQKNYFLIPKDENIQYINNPKELIGVDNIESLAIKGFPTLIQLIDCRVENFYTGKKEILNYIKNSSI